MIAKYQQQQQQQRIDEMNQKLYELLEKSGVSFASTNKTDWEKLASGMIDAIGLSGSVKESILKLGKLSFTSQDEVLAYMKSIKGYEKILKVGGAVTGITSAIISLDKYYQNPSTANFVAFITNTAAIGFGPYASVAFGAFSMTKYANEAYQIIGNQINNGCNCNAGGNIYDLIKRR